jgi:membrane protein required for beta-lactamase induction
MKHLHIVGLFSIAIMVLFTLMGWFPVAWLVHLASFGIPVLIVGMVVAVLRAGPGPKPVDEEERPFYEDRP